MQTTKKVNNSLNYFCPFYWPKRRKQRVSSESEAETLGCLWRTWSKYKVNVEEKKIPRARKCDGLWNAPDLGERMEGPICWSALYGVLGWAVAVYTSSLLTLTSALLLSPICLPFTLQSLQEFLIDFVPRFYIIFFTFLCRILSTSENGKI